MSESAAAAATSSSSSSASEPHPALTRPAILSHIFKFAVHLNVFQTAVTAAAEAAVKERLKAAREPRNE